MSEYGAALSMETVTIQKIRKNTFFIVMISVTVSAEVWPLMGPFSVPQMRQG
jgi:hypothetical protein